MMPCIATSVDMYPQDHCGRVDGAVAKAELELAADNALKRGEFHVVTVVWS